MVDVNTDSYPKPPALPVQKNALEQAQQWGGLQQQQQQIQSGAIQIDKQKLDLINTQFGVMNNELSTLANDPSITKEQAAKRLVTISKTLNLPDHATEHMMMELKEAPNVSAFAKNALVRGMSTQEKVNNLYGSPGSSNNGQTVTPTITSPMIAGGAPRQTGLPIQQQIPPNQPVINNGVETLQGPTPPVTPPGTVALPTPLALPVARNPSAGNNFGTSTASPNSVVQDRYPAPSGPTVGQSPLFGEGLKAYTADQSEASNRMMAAKPAIQALPLMQTKGFLSGPGTEGFTKGVAALKSWGLIDTADENDPTAIRQEVNKKLAAYVSSSPVGQRSDAAQSLKEAASPSAKVQILPALVKLTKDAVALDRIQAAMPNAFKGVNYENYVKHRGTFPQSVDEKAFTLDLEPEEKTQKLVKDMALKEQSKDTKERAEAAKFFKSLRIAKEQGFYN